MPEELRIGSAPSATIYTEEEIVEAVQKLNQPDLEHHEKERIFKNIAQYNNQKKYGYSDWYSWSVANWGTKWDACDTDITAHSEDVLQLRFSTAWNLPKVWLERLFTMEEFMPLRIVHFHEDEGECVGGRTKKNGLPTNVISLRTQVLLNSGRCSFLVRKLK